MNRVELLADDFVNETQTRVLGLHLSTFDVPRRGFAEFDPQSGVLAIRFQYIDQEPESTKTLTDHITAKVGKHSGKIIALDIKMAEYNFGEVRMTVSKALDDVNRVLGERVSSLKRFNERDNYKLVQSVIHQQRPIVESAAAP